MVDLLSTFMDAPDKARRLKSSYDDVYEYGARKFNSEYSSFDEFQESRIKKGLESSKAPFQMGHSYIYSEVLVEGPIGSKDSVEQLERDIRQEGGRMYAHKLINELGISSLGEADKLEDHTNVTVDDGRVEIKGENGIVFTINHGTREVTSPMIMARGLNATPEFQNVPEEFFKNRNDEFIINPEELYSDGNLTYDGEGSDMREYRMELLEFERLRDSGSIAQGESKLWMNTYPEVYDYSNSVWFESKLTNYSIPEESLDLLFEEMTRTPVGLDVNDKPSKGSIQTRDLLYGGFNYINHARNGSDGYRLGSDAVNQDYSDIRNSKFTINGEVIFDDRDIFAEIEEEHARDAEILVNDRIAYEDAQVEAPILLDITYQKVEMTIVPPAGVSSNRPSKYDELLDKFGPDEYVNQMFKAMDVSGFDDTAGFSKIPRLEQTDNGFNYTDVHGYKFYITESEQSISTGMIDFQGLSATPTFQNIPERLDDDDIPKDFNVDSEILRNNNQHLDSNMEMNVDELRMFMSTLERDVSEGKMGDMSFKGYSLPRIYNASADMEDDRSGLTEYELNGDTDTINTFYDDLYALTDRYRPDHAGYVSTKDVIHTFVNHIDRSRQGVDGYDMSIRNDRPVNNYPTYKDLRESKLKVNGKVLLDDKQYEETKEIDGVAPAIAGMFSDLEIEQSKSEVQRKNDEAILNEGRANRESFKKLNDKYEAKLNKTTIDTSKVIEDEIIDDFDLEL